MFVFFNGNTCGKIFNFFVRNTIYRLNLSKFRLPQSLKAIIVFFVPLCPVVYQRNNSDSSPWNRWFFLCVQRYAHYDPRIPRNSENNIYQKWINMHTG